MQKGGKKKGEREKRGLRFEGKQRTRGARTGREVRTASPWPRERSTLCLLDKSRFTITWGWSGGPDMYCTL